MATNVCVGYGRVSTDDQAEHGVSLAMQETRVKGWAVSCDYEVRGWYHDDGISGKRSVNRPRLQAAIEHACNLHCPLVVYSLSRLARSTTDAIDISTRLHKAGADLVSLTERIDTTTAAGKMVFRMLAVLAEFERDLVSERTTAAMAHLRRQGKRISRHIPYGSTLAPDGVALVNDQVEQTVIDLIKLLHAEGKSLRTIAQVLDDRGVMAKQGSGWSAQSVSGVLSRARVASPSSTKLTDERGHGV